MGSLNLEDFALDDTTTGMAVQIGNFKVLLLSDYSSFVLNYVPATVDIGQQHPDWLQFLGTLLGVFIKENLCRRNGFFYFGILPSNSCGARAATRYSGDFKSSFREAS